MSRTARHWFTILFLCAVTSIVWFVFHKGAAPLKTPQSETLPKGVTDALARISKIKVGMKEGEVFSFLGLPKPFEPLHADVEGRTRATWTQYDIGYGKEFVLECESMNTRQSELFDFDDGVLYFVRICRLQNKSDGQPSYATITPSWQDPAWKKEK